jgi:uridine phosphorylase
MPHHLGHVRTDASIAIVTGDPDRVPRLAAALGHEAGRWARRGFLGIEVEAHQAPVLICSTGIGGPSTAIVVEELVELGVGAVIRVGTCGSLQRHVVAGDLVLSSGSVRDDGTSVHYLPLAFPAVPDFALLAAIDAAAREGGYRCHVGITHCKDAYYSEDPVRMPMPERSRDHWAMLRAAGVLATEMEAATLFVVAAVRGIRAAAVVMAIDDSLDAEIATSTLQHAARASVAGACAIADTATDAVEVR